MEKTDGEVYGKIGVKDHPQGATVRSVDEGRRRGVRVWSRKWLGRALCDPDCHFRQGVKRIFSHLRRFSALDP